MYEIKQINVWVATRYATTFAFIISTIGSLLGFGLFLIEMLGRSTYRYGYRSIDFEDLVPFFAIPLIATFLAFCATALFAALYNILAEKLVGLQIDLEFVDEPDSNDANKRA